MRCLAFFCVFAAACPIYAQNFTSVTAGNIADRRRSESAASSRAVKDSGARFDWGARRGDSRNFLAWLPYKCLLLCLIHLPDHHRATRRVAAVQQSFVPLDELASPVTDLRQGTEAVVLHLEQLVPMGERFKTPAERKWLEFRNHSAMARFIAYALPGRGSDGVGSDPFLSPCYDFNVIKSARSHVKLKIAQARLTLTSGGGTH